jgi:lipopolysaccharide transport system ATP-binding protein
MAGFAIRCEQISKRYSIGKQERYSTLRDTLSELAFQPFRLFRQIRHKRATAKEEISPSIWALRNISIQIEAGTAVGIIGSNGAGKSTLLKILSRVTKPTHGIAEIHGRVASILEVGIGFHPELTGRENIYLNGAILGMKRSEIELNFDQIVAFAEVEKFLDTPLKHYSSGMYTRLAFAVAAHLDPEILLIDEVLAVGDVLFQKKCLGRLDNVKNAGRTVLFVSHNMLAVESLCDQVIWIDRGSIVDVGTPTDIISRYLKTASSSLSEQLWRDVLKAPGNDTVRLRRVAVRPIGGTPGDAISVETSFVMEFEYWNLKPNAYLDLSIQVVNAHGIIVFDTTPLHEKVWHGQPLPAGLFHSVCQVPAELLNTGSYRVHLLVAQNQGFICFQLDEALVFDVRENHREGWLGEWPGAVRPNLHWTTEFVGSP